MDIPKFSLEDLRKRIGKELSNDAFSIVYSLRGLPYLAVKEIQIDGQDDSFIEGIRFEIAAFAKLSHPGVLRYYQIIEDEDVIYIIMDHYSSTLNHLIIGHKMKKTSISDDVLFSIVKQIIDALVYLSDTNGVDIDGNLHEGLVYKDLRPSNILISEDGSRIALAGFELYKDLHEMETLLQKQICTSRPRLFFAGRQVMPLTYGLLA